MNSSPSLHKTTSSSVDDSALELDLFTLCKAVFRRWKLCCAVVVFSLALALAYCFCVTPTYLASGTIQALVGQTKFSSYDSVELVGNQDQKTFIATQVKAFCSDSIKTALFEKFNLAASEEFSSSKNPLKKFDEKLVIKQIPNTSYIKVGVKDASPEKAATMANALMDLFLKKNIEQSKLILAKALSALNSEIQSIEKKRGTASNELLNFYKKNNVSSCNSERAAILATIPELSKQLEKAGSQAFTEIQTKLNALNTRLKEVDRLALEERVLTSNLEAIETARGNLKRRILEITNAYNTNSDSIGVFKIIDKAAVPLEKKSPKRAKILVITLLASLLVAILLSIALELLDTTIKTKEELKNSASPLPLLGEIKAKGIGEELSSLKTAIDVTNENTGVLALTSIGGAKESALSENLATLYAHTGKKVLFIGDSFTKETLKTDFFTVLKNETFNIKGKAGDVARLPLRQNLDQMLTVDTVKVQGFLAKAKENFDIVLFQLQSKSAFAKALFSSKEIPCLLVCETYTTKKEELVETLGELSLLGTPFIGTVLTHRAK